MGVTASSWGISSLPWEVETGAPSQAHPTSPDTRGDETREAEWLTARKAAGAAALSQCLWLRHGFVPSCPLPLFTWFCLSADQGGDLGAH